MSATQRVEGFFGKLKRLVHSSASLVVLGQTISDLCDEEMVETNRCAEYLALDVSGGAW